MNLGKDQIDLKTIFNTELIKNIDQDKGQVLQPPLARNRGKEELRDSANHSFSDQTLQSKSHYSFFEKTFTSKKSEDELYKKFDYENQNLDAIHKVILQGYQGGESNGSIAPLNNLGIVLQWSLERTTDHQLIESESAKHITRLNELMVKASSKIALMSLIQSTNLFDLVIFWFLLLTDAEGHWERDENRLVDNYFAAFPVMARLLQSTILDVLDVEERRKLQAELDSFMPKLLELLEKRDSDLEEMFVQMLPQLKMAVNVIANKAGPHPDFANLVAIRRKSRQLAVSVQSTFGLSICDIPNDWWQDLAFVFLALYDVELVMKNFVHKRLTTLVPREEDSEWTWLLEVNRVLNKENLYIENDTESKDIIGSMKIRRLHTAMQNVNKLLSVFGYRSACAWIDEIKTAILAPASSWCCNSAIDYATITRLADRLAMFMDIATQRCTIDAALLKPSVKDKS